MAWERAAGSPHAWAASGRAGPPPRKSVSPLAVFAALARFEEPGHCAVGEVAAGPRKVPNGGAFGAAPWGAAGAAGAVCCSVSAGAGADSVVVAVPVGTGSVVVCVAVGVVCVVVGVVVVLGGVVVVGVVDVVVGALAVVLVLGLSAFWFDLAGGRVEVVVVGAGCDGAAAS